MIRNVNLKEYFAISWVRFLFWAVLATTAIALIAVIANYLTFIVFHIK